MIQSLSEKWAGCCLWLNGQLARRDEGEYPLWIFD
jgi:hypothetical protein